MAMTLIPTNTESGDATSDFTSGIDSTYKLFIFKFLDINPATDGSVFLFNGSIDAGSNYNVTKTTTCFRAYHYEGAATTTLGFDGTPSLAQSTAFQTLTTNNANPDDGSSVGILHLFNPASTTFVKHFLCRTVQNTFNGENCMSNTIGGYFNTTSAIDAIQFKFASGNIDEGSIFLHGLTI